MRRSVLLLFLCAITAIAAPAQTFTTLYHFHGYADGYSPYGSLVQGADGQFYGEAVNGGIYGGGTAFKITAKGVLTTLYFFDLNKPSEPSELLAAWCRGWTEISTVQRGAEALTTAPCSKSLQMGP